MRAVSPISSCRLAIVRRWLHLVIVFAALVAVPPVAQAHHAATNVVVAYLDGAERQAESADQEREIARALQDLRSLPPATLPTRRYADYALVPDRWTLTELIAKYYVPRVPTTLDPATFYRDARDPRALAVIDAHLIAIREHRQVRALH